VDIMHGEPRSKKQRAASCEGEFGFEDGKLFNTCVSVSPQELSRYLGKDQANAADSRGGASMTPLMTAAYEGNLRVVRYLIENEKVDVEARHTDNSTAFLWAGYMDECRVLRYLAENAKANIEAEDLSGRTALLWAVARGFHRSVRYLVEDAKANVNRACRNGTTPVIYAADKSNKEVVQCLVEHDADVEIEDKMMRTPLNVAVGSCCLETVRYLIEHAKASAHRKTHLGKSLLIYSRDLALNLPHHKKWEVVTYLTKLSARRALNRDLHGLEMLHPAVLENLVRVGAPAEFEPYGC